MKWDSDKLSRLALVYRRYSGHVMNVSIAACLFFMVSVITVDIAGRFFGHSILIADEMSRYSFLVITYLGLATTERVGKHIDIDLLTGKFSGRTRYWLAIVVTMVSIALLAWLTLVTAKQVYVVYAGNEVSRTLLKAPLWIPYLCVPLGFAAMSLELVLQLLLRFSRAPELEQENRLLVGKTALEK